jgi:hypothetical protein
MGSFYVKGGCARGERINGATHHHTRHVVKLPILISTKLVNSISIAKSGCKTFEGDRNRVAARLKREILLWMHIGREDRGQLAIIRRSHLVVMPLNLLNLMHFLLWNTAPL